MPGLVIAGLLLALGAGGPQPTGADPTSDWVFEVVDSGWPAGAGICPAPSLALDGSGVPHIAYFRDDTDTLRYARQNGSIWDVQNVVSMEHLSCGGFSLAVDPVDEPRIAFSNLTGLYYAYRDGGTWRTILLDSGSILVGAALVNQSGLASIAYMPFASYDVKFAYEQSLGVWRTEVVESAGTVGVGLRARLSSDGTPYLVYADITRGSLKVANRNGGSWAIQEWDPGSPRGPDLAFDSSGRVWLAYHENVGGYDKLRVGRPNGTSWELAPPAFDGREPRLYLDSRGFPRLLYCRSGAGISYARWQEAAWSSERFGTAGCEGSFILSADVPHVAFPRSIAVYYATVGADVRPPDSHVLPISPYWAASPLQVAASALDAQGYVASVALWYRYSSDNASWNAWAVLSTLAAPPWSWSFAFPDGDGHYEFYATSQDHLGNTEPPPPVADAVVGRDTVPPASTALAVSPYWHTSADFNVSANASDALSGVAEVVLRYSFSPDNVTFGPWVPFRTLAAPPWNWTFFSPDGEGYYRFHTIARDVAGNNEGSKAGWEAEAGYRRPDAPPVAVAGASPTVVSMGQAVTFDGTGSTDDRGIVGYLWDFGDGATDPRPIATHAYASRGAFYAVLTVWDAAGQNDTDAVTIDVVNRPPVADAGPDQVAVRYALVQLDGSGSADPDGDALTYAWSQLAGPPVTLASADTATPTFTPSVPGSYAFRLTVDDGLGGNASDDANVAVENRAPVADAGADQAAAKYAPVQLDGSGSADPDGDALTYAWSQLAGPAVALNGANTVTPTFTPVTSGTYSFRLAVDDGWGGTSSDAVNVTVENRAPVAAAGPDRIGAKNSAVTLDATASFDPDGDSIAYAWTQTGGPSVVLSDPSAALATFTAARAGTYTFRLRVTDSEGVWSEDDITITVPNAPPVARLAANPATVRVGRPVAFDGTGSADPDGSIVDYAFDFGDGARTNGSAATASHAYASAGTYVAVLTVTDDEGAANSTQATIAALANVPPTAVPSVWPLATGTLDTTFFFDGSNSTDDVIVVSWRWEFGDGTTAPGERASHRYAAKGPYTVTLTVTDDEGASASATLTVQVVNRPPVITDAYPSGSVSLLAGRGQRFVVTASDPDGDPLSYAWTVDGAVAGTDAAAFDFAADPGVYRVNVTVSDGESAAWHEWTVRVEPSPAETPTETNWKPAVAATFAVLLAVAGAWSSRKRPWKGGTGRKAVLRAFALTALPFVLAEAGTGVVSLATGLLSIPPLLGAGAVVDGGLLVVGVATALLRVRRGRAPR